MPTQTLTGYIHALPSNQQQLILIISKHLNRTFDRAFHRTIILRLLQNVPLEGLLSLEAEKELTEIKLNTRQHSPLLGKLLFDWDTIITMTTANAPKPKGLGRIVSWAIQGLGLEIYIIKKMYGIDLTFSKNDKETDQTVKKCIVIAYFLYLSGQPFRMSDNSNSYNFN
jgi:hypothetical protein